MALPGATADFWIGTTTARIMTRQETFAALLKALQELQQKLNQFLR
ncbi:MAG: hypothetical protein U1A23_04875 [Candidatus Sungbacteria bacterium]|nr:hypothetical protein [bacterium]MDZ4286236.1 hypothetical protein [Candidatus Sungbacteria bacterium]